MRCAIVSFLFCLSTCHIVQQESSDQCFVGDQSQQFLSIVLSNISSKNTNLEESTTETVTSSSLDKCIVHDCMPLKRRRCDDHWNSTVHILNATEFSALLKSRKTVVTDNWCMIVMFFAPSCPFSAILASAFNLLPYAFPCLHAVAVDATHYSRLNLIYGVAGTPTVILFHNAKPVTRYDMENLDFLHLVQFVEASTNLNAVAIRDAELKQKGPLRTEPLRSVNYNLIGSWIFILVCFCYFLAKSEFSKRGWLVLKRLLKNQYVSRA
ncbi:unnamed protein product [Soboliphyme baturini]|uniref:Thioredoxin domain-containing protein n=1 Tax=Soboliphyme baturini TaxID=241478 RepID=A0A183IMG0_9BILA|nr:unnamed protein product [Soboliphyme baturini]